MEPQYGVGKWKEFHWKMKDSGGPEGRGQREIAENELKWSLSMEEENASNSMGK